MKYKGIYITLFNKILLGCCLGLLLMATTPLDNRVISNSLGGTQLIDEVLISKAFPLLGFLKKEDSILRNNTVIRNVTKNLVLRLEDGLHKDLKVGEYGRLIQWQDTEITIIGNELINLYQRESSFKTLVAELRKSGQYNLYEKENDTTLIRKAWRDVAYGINNILKIYVQGEKPLYPKIDSIGYSQNDQNFKNKIRTSFKNQLENFNQNKNLFYMLPLNTGIAALNINERDEATRYEPLDQGENRKTKKYIKTINWESYNYSVLLVPGQGPSIVGQRLDPLSIYRCTLAAERYKNKIAPIIVVSGGHVHPNKTQFSEAVEMKKYLIEELEIPEEAILIEPHARHTTTNLRNTTRLINSYSIPFHLPVMIVTSEAQNNYINGKMGSRAKKELGYMPYKNLRKLNTNESEFHPTLLSLQANPFDILDP